MSYTTTAHINLAALQHNLRQVRHHAPHSKIVAMVKANAYGHGLIPIVHALHDVDALGVARIQEALVLRKVGINTPIILMEGFSHEWELPIIVEHNLTIVIHQMQQVRHLINTKTHKPISVWLKLDTGMHRLGFTATEFLQAWHLLKTAAAVAPEIVLMTHFSCAEETHSAYTTEQLQLFNKVIANLPGSRSMANSAAIIAHPTTHAEWVRPGIMLYGISPFADKTAKELGLLPVMTLSSRLLAIHHLKQGEAIGYNRTFICSEDMDVGVVAAGYGDGYPRYIPPEGTPALINDQITQVIGRVSMDMLYIDLRKVISPQLGDTITLWGASLPLENIAKAAHTNTYELLCGITQRVEFNYQ